MPNPAIDVAIIGAGPVGLTMAAVLTRAGLKCRLIDKAPAPSDKATISTWTYSGFDPTFARSPAMALHFVTTIRTLPAPG